MKPIIPAVATAVMVPPQLVLNTDRKGPFDVLSGSFSENMNEFFARARINGTLIDSEYGECFSDGSCTGQMNLMKSGQADFSLFGLSSEFFVAIQDLRIGPFTEAVEVFFQSIPYTNPTQIFSTQRINCHSRLIWCKQ